MPNEIQTLFPGISQRIIDTPRLKTAILERDGDDPATSAQHTVAFIHGNVSSSLFWQETMLALPEHLRVIAIDLRGFGASETAPVDATRGLGDFGDDVAEALDALDIPAAHLVGWSMGGGVILQYALDHAHSGPRALSLTLQAPVSPYGFGGTRRDGTRLNEADAGCGAGGGNADFIARLKAGDMSSDEQTSPRNVLRASYVAPGYASEHEDIWVASMLTTSTEPGNYPGNSVATEAWPGFGAGDTGVLNTMAPQHFNASGIVQLADKPPILWVHGDQDAIVSDASFFDFNHLGALGIIPGWPGEELAPAQQMVSQTRDVLDTYRAAGGRVTEVLFEGAGHSPHLERPEGFCEALLTHIG